MKILAVGDIVGENGVAKLNEMLPKIKQENNIDFCVVNGENSAGGMGITTKIFQDMLKLNIDVITMRKSHMGKKRHF